jgi:AraC-like DNA-binding protein
MVGMLARSRYPQIAAAIHVVQNFAFMRLAPTPLFERQRIFHSQDVDATRSFLDGFNFRIDFLRRGAPGFDARVNGIYMPGMWLGYIQYGSEIAVRRLPKRDDYWVQLPLRGHIEARIRKEDVVGDPGRALVTSPCHDSLVRYEVGTTRLNLSLTAVEMNRLLAALLGEWPAAPLEFAPGLDMRQGHGRSLARFVRMAALDLQSPDSLLWNPGAMTEFARFVMTGLLLSHPHSYSERLRRRDRAPGPSDVKRAIDYMQEHMSAPVSLVDIVAEAGVPGRTLFKHFRDFRGTSPMQYLRNARLDKAREALHGAQSGETVTSVAMGLGFGHLGRFSRDYLRRFGERPSETIRRKR